MGVVPTLSSAFSACPSFCPVDRTCGHYKDFGEDDSECCPSCKVPLSACPGIECPAERGCLRYAPQVREGECCLRCVRWRNRINNNPGMYLVYSLYNVCTLQTAPCDMGKCVLSEVSCLNCLSTNYLEVHFQAIESHQHT